MKKSNTLSESHDSPVAGIEIQAWNEINFKKCQIFVNRLQVSIAKAVQFGNQPKAKKMGKSKKETAGEIPYQTKEPYEVKVSRTVLKTSRHGKPCLA